MFSSRIVSSLEKCFLSEKAEDKPVLSRLHVFKNESFSFQLIYREDDPSVQLHFLQVHCSGPFRFSIRTVENIISTYPVFPHAYDDNYISTEPGLYPDVLVPTHYGSGTPFAQGQLRSVWIECEPEGDITGEQEIRVRLSAEPHISAEHTLYVDISDAMLAETDFKLTQWFHADCLASYYNVEVFSEKHWQIIESYIKTAVRNGINMILTPIFTPPLDTAIGHERLTVQLVKVNLTGGRYSFDFSLLSRWIDTCLDAGVKYFEMSHLFSQWGASRTPKIMANKDGEYIRLFGWETDSCSDEYRSFLSAFVPRLIRHLKKKGVDRRCYFHISDEPNRDCLEQYKNAKSGVEELLSGYPVIDALSDVEFYKSGVIENPIPGVEHAEEFIKAGVKHPWTYYCCGQNRLVPNRFVAMPSARNRIIGILFYKFKIEGFLQWGYNFYNNCGSVDAINPYINTSGDYWVPTGDTCSVWPAQDGTAYESLRIRVFYDALQDMRALYAAEERIGRDKVMALLEEGLDSPLSFTSYPKDAEYILGVRKKLFEALS